MSNDRQWRFQVRVRKKGANEMFKSAVRFFWWDQSHYFDFKVGSGDWELLLLSCCPVVLPHYRLPSRVEGVDSRYSPSKGEAWDELLFETVPKR